MNEKLIKNNEKLDFKRLNFNDISIEEKLKIYQELAKCKNYAINKARKNYFNLPLETEDFEFAAWKAFNESLTTFKPENNRTFESYFIDTVVWRCADYCKSFVTNRHKALNLSNSKYYEEEVIIDQREHFSDRLTVNSVIENYIQNLKNVQKQSIANEFLQNFLSPSTIIEKLSYSKSTVYRYTREIVKDITILLI